MITITLLLMYIYICMCVFAWVATIVLCTIFMRTYQCVHVEDMHTVQPVYNDHARDQVIVTSVDRWSLYRGASVQLKWTMSQPTVVSTHRRSLYASGLQDMF